MNTLDRFKFTLLLTAVASLLVIYPAASLATNASLAVDCVVSGLLIGVLFAVFQRHPARWAAYSLVAPTVIGNWVAYSVSGPDAEGLTVGFHLCAAAYLTLTLIITLTAVYTAERITFECVAGAFCGYLLLGIIFGHVYWLIAYFAPESFTGGLEPDGRHRFFQLIHFSFGALTTAGAGDFYARVPPVRGISMLETVIGQFYMAGLIAELISKRATQLLTPPPAPPAPADLGVNTDVGVNTVSPP